MSIISPNLKKTIIHVWTQEFLELDVNKTENFFGFGDLIRCSIQLYKLCKCMNYNFILDISLHPISQFYNEYKHKYSELIKDNKNNIYHIPEYMMLRYISINIKKQDVVYFISNFGSSIYEHNFCENKYETIERVNYFKKIFTPNDSFMNYLNTNYQDILNTNYNIIHYRLGDEYLLNKNTESFDKIYIHLCKIYNNNSIFICDSNEFKKYILEKNNKNINKIKMLNTNACHIGKCKDSNMLKNTLSELYIISNSKHINTYSTYEWVSGFVCHISRLYNISINTNINVVF